MSIKSVIQKGINLSNIDLTNSTKSFRYCSNTKSFLSYGCLIAKNMDDGEYWIIYNDKDNTKTMKKHITQLINYLMDNEINFIIEEKEKIILKEYINKNKNYECPITLTTFKKGYITKCKHIFSKKALDLWIKADNNICPYCRQKL